MNDIVDLFFDSGEDFVPVTINAVFELAGPSLSDYVPEERAIVVKNENYFEYVIPRCTDSQFRDHFRMSRTTFEDLSVSIGRMRPSEEDRTIPLTKKVMYTLWILSKPESFLEAGDRFGFAKSTAHKIYSEITEAIVALSSKYIKWPSMQKHMHTATIFEARSRGISGVVGAIDGCHIAIKQPGGNAVDFYNRKGFHSIILQGVCDERGLFIDTTIGRPGRMHDARVFRLSEIYARTNKCKSTSATTFTSNW